MSSFKTSLLAVAITATLLTACNREAAPVVDATPAPVVDATPAAAPAPAATTPAPADAQMQSVLDALGKLGGKPIESLDPVEARQQPTPADAVAEVLKAQGKPTAPEAVGKSGEAAQFRGQNFEGHRPAQGRICSQIDCAHAPATDHAGDLVFRQKPTDFLHIGRIPRGTAGVRVRRAEGVLQQPPGGCRTQARPTGGRRRRGVGRGIHGQPKRQHWQQAG